ncbi:MAG: 50S ribosomal protein L10 [bacterium]
MNRDEKQDMVTALGEIFNGAQVGLLIDYIGLNVAEISDLRRRLHESDSNMRVLKNRIAKLAIKDTPFATLEEQLSKPRALIYGDEPAASAKVLSKFLREHEKISYILGVLVTPTGTKVLEQADMRALGALPSREELLVKLLFVVQSPPTQFVRTLNEIPAKFVRTLAALAASREGAEAGV